MTTNSFIANINKLAEKLDIVIQAVDLFDEDVVPVLREIADLDLQEAIDDLKKSNYLGNRKVDINLLYNMVGVDENTPQDEAEAIWLNPSKTVRYDKATVMFTDGTTHVVEFTFDGNPTTIATHADLMVQFNNDTEFLAS